MALGWVFRGSLALVFIAVVVVPSSFCLHCYFVFSYFTSRNACLSSWLFLFFLSFPILLFAFVVFYILLFLFLIFRSEISGYSDDDTQAIREAEAMTTRKRRKDLNLSLYTEEADISTNSGERGYSGSIMPPADWDECMRSDG
jgi:uncharacterized membrane protein